jgi:hypothetical protein
MEVYRVVHKLRFYINWFSYSSIVSTHSLLQLSPYLEVANYAPTHEIPSILWNTKVHCRLHKSHKLVPNLSQINPFNTIPSDLKSILILSTHLRQSGQLHSGFLTNRVYAFFFSHNRSKCPLLNGGKHYLSSVSS